MTETRNGVEVHADDVPALLDRWARLGLLSPEQVEQILAYERGPAPRAATVPGQRLASPATGAPSRNRLAVEALGYLGGVLALAASLLLVQLFWKDLPTGGRLAVPVAAALALLASGALVPATPPHTDGLGRLRSVLWLLAVGATAGAFGVLGDQVLDLEGRDTALLVGLGMLAVGVPLYLRTTAAAQQVGIFAATLVTATAIGQRADWDEPTLVGLAGWLVAVTWFVLGERRFLQPSIVARYLGAAGSVAMVLPMGGSIGGQVVAIATLAGIFVYGVHVDSLGLLAVASVGTLTVVPSVVTFFFPDDAGVVVPIGLLGIGGVLVGTAVTVARRRGHAPPRR